MPDEPIPTPEPKPEEPAPAIPLKATPLTEQDKEDIGDFIARHVLEKDTVFFEG